MFVNMGWRSLSLKAQHPPRMEITGELEELARLRDVRLRGHVPRELMQKLLRAARGVKSLDLGHLDVVKGPFRLESPPLGLRKAQKDLIPCSLSWMAEHWTPNFQMLTILSLSKPSISDFISFPVDLNRDVNEPVLQEWCRPIRLVREQIVELKFDLLEIADSINFDDNLIVKEQATLGTERFCKIVVPVLLEKGDWPALRRLEFQGAHIKCSSPASLIDELAQKFRSTHIQHTCGRYMIFDEGCGQLWLDHVGNGLGYTYDC